MGRSSSDAGDGQPYLEAADGCTPDTPAITAAAAVAEDAAAAPAALAELPLGPAELMIALAGLLTAAPAAAADEADGCTAAESSVALAEAGAGEEAAGDAVACLPQLCVDGGGPAGAGADTGAEAGLAHAVLHDGDDRPQAEAEWLAAAAACSTSANGVAAAAAGVSWQQTPAGDDSVTEAQLVAEGPTAFEEEEVAGTAPLGAESSSRCGVQEWQGTGSSGGRSSSSLGDAGSIKDPSIESLIGSRDGAGMAATIAAADACSHEPIAALMGPAAVAAETEVWVPPDEQAAATTPPEAAAAALYEQLSSSSSACQAATGVAHADAHAPAAAATEVAAGAQPGLLTHARTETETAPLGRHVAAAAGCCHELVEPGDLALAVTAAVVEEAAAAIAAMADGGAATALEGQAVGEQAHRDAEQLEHRVSPTITLCAQQMTGAMPSPFPPPQQQQQREEQQEEPCVQALTEQDKLQLRWQQQCEPCLVLEIAAHQLDGGSPDGCNTSNPGLPCPVMEPPPSLQPASCQHHTPALQLQQESMQQEPMQQRPGEVQCTSAAQVNVDQEGSSSHDATTAAASGAGHATRGSHAEGGTTPAPGGTTAVAAADNSELSAAAGETKGSEVAEAADFLGDAGTPGPKAGSWLDVAAQVSPRAAAHGLTNGGLTAYHGSRCLSSSGSGIGDVTCATAVCGTAVCESVPMVPPPAASTTATAAAMEASDTGNATPERTQAYAAFVADRDVAPWPTGDEACDTPACSNSSSSSTAPASRVQGPWPHRPQSVHPARAPGAAAATANGGSCSSRSSIGNHAVCSHQHLPQPPPAVLQRCGGWQQQQRRPQSPRALRSPRQQQQQLQQGTGALVRPSSAPAAGGSSSSNNSSRHHSCRGRSLSSNSSCLAAAQCNGLHLHQQQLQHKQQDAGGACSSSLLGVVAEDSMEGEQRWWRQRQQLRGTAGVVAASTVGRAMSTSGELDCTLQQYGWLAIGGPSNSNSSTAANQQQQHLMGMLQQQQQQGGRSLSRKQQPDWDDSPLPLYIPKWVPIAEAVLPAAAAGGAAAGCRNTGSSNRWAHSIDSTGDRLGNSGGWDPGCFGDVAHPADNSRFGNSSSSSRPQTAGPVLMQHSQSLWGRALEAEMHESTRLSGSLVSSTQARLAGQCSPRPSSSPHRAGSRPSTAANRPSKNTSNNSSRGPGSVSVYLQDVLLQVRQANAYCKQLNLLKQYKLAPWGPGSTAGTTTCSAQAEQAGSSSSRGKKWQPQQLVELWELVDSGQLQGTRGASPRQQQPPPAAQQQQTTGATGTMPLACATWQLQRRLTLRQFTQHVARLKNLTAAEVAAAAVGAAAGPAARCRPASTGRIRVQGSAACWQQQWPNTSAAVAQILSRPKTASSAIGGSNSSSSIYSFSRHDITVLSRSGSGTPGLRRHMQMPDRGAAGAGAAPTRLFSSMVPSGPAVSPCQVLVLSPRGGGMMGCVTASAGRHAQHGLEAAGELPSAGQVQPLAGCSGGGGGGGNSGCSSRATKHARPASAPRSCSRLSPQRY